MMRFDRFARICLVLIVLLVRENSIVYAQQIEIPLQLDAAPVTQTLQFGESINFLVSFDNESSGRVLYVTFVDLSSPNCGVNVSLNSSTDSEPGSWQAGYSFDSWRSDNFTIQLVVIFGTCNITAVAQTQNITRMNWGETASFEDHRQLPFLAYIAGNFTLPSNDSVLYTSPFIVNATARAPPYPSYQASITVRDKDGAASYGMYYTYANIVYVDGGVGILPSSLYIVVEPLTDDYILGWAITFIARPVQLLADNGPPVTIHSPYPTTANETQLVLTQSSLLLPFGLVRRHNVTVSLVSGQCSVYAKLTALAGQTVTNTIYPPVLFPQQPTYTDVIDLGSNATDLVIMNWIPSNQNYPQFSSGDCAFTVLLGVDQTQSATSMASITSALSTASSTVQATTSTTAEISSSTLATATSTSDLLSTSAISASSASSLSATTTGATQSTTASATASLTSTTFSSTFAMSSSTSSTATASVSATTSAHATSMTATTGGVPRGHVDLPDWGVALIVIAAFVLGALCIAAGYFLFASRFRRDYELIRESRHA